MQKNRRLTFNLTRHWFDEIWEGRKDREYREIKPHWEKRLHKYLGDTENLKAYFQTGYGNPDRWIIADVEQVYIGTCPYEGWDSLYYVTKFSNVRRFERNQKVESFDMIKA